MSRIARLLAGFLVLATGIAARAGTPIEQMALPVEHPMLGLVFDSNATRFEPLSATVRKICKLEKGARYFVMARLAAGDTEVIVTIGRTSGPDDDMFGLVLETKGGHCEETDSLWMQMGRQPAGMLPDNAPTAGLTPGRGAPEICVNGECHYILRSQAELNRLHALVQDALTRAEAAMGGRDNVKRELCGSGILSDERTPEVGKVLTAYCRP